MDEWCKRHLATWADDYFLSDEEREAGVAAILREVDESPELLDTRSWTEILAIAEGSQ